jgi:intracellular sulfur oxidation DsrE/DsrF family protein
MKNLLYTITVLMMMVLPIFASEIDDEDDVVKVVYQCDFSDVKRIHLMINTINNASKYYDKHLIPYEIDVVALGPCLQYMMKDFKNTGFVKKPYLNHGGPTTAGTTSRFKNLKQLGGDNIKFFACNNTMTKKNVKADQLEEFVKVTPAGIIKAIDLQRQGYAYIKIK